MRRRAAAVGGCPFRRRKWQHELILFHRTLRRRMCWLRALRSSLTITSRPRCLRRLIRRGDATQARCRRTHSPSSNPIRSPVGPAAAPVRVDGGSVSARGRARSSIRSPAGREEATPSPIWSSASLRVKPPRLIAGGTVSPTRAGAHREGRDLGHGRRWLSSRSACLPAACLRVLIPCAAATRRRSRSRLPMRTPEQGLPSRR